MSDKEEAFEEAKKRIALEMENDARYIIYFAQYDEGSIKPFINHYAYHKARLEIYGNSKQNSEQSLLIEWQKVAWDCLKEIQHKKLFDLACRWLAGQVRDIPDVVISRDFSIIENRILNYTGISSISEDELNFYLQYLREEKNVLGYYHQGHDYQEYERVKKHFDTHMNTGIPYYDYHNQYTGNDQLLKLKALKKEKEDAYLETTFKERRKKTVKPVEKKGKPNLSSTDEEFVRFAKKFQDRKTANFIESLVEYRNNQQDSKQEWAVIYLNEIGSEQVPISAGNNWIDALYESAVGHRQEKIQEILPAIYEEYLMRKSTGIQFTLPGKRPRKDFLENWYKTAILDGRELCGEPRNFDY
jgi:hypothetical protein